MRIRMREEQGAALVVALLVTLVVALLATVVIQQAIHNTESSGYNRSRLTSVNAAEAGLNHYFNYLGGTSIDLLSTSAATRNLGSDPGTSSFTATPTFYADAAGTQPFVGEPSVSNYPKSVKIVSVGSTNGRVDRAMETFIVLSPVYGGLNGALVANSNTVFTNNFTVNGNNGNDGDIYVMTGNFTNPSGLEQVHGNIYVKNGTATIDTQIHLYGTLWANGGVTIDHPQADIDGDVKSTTSSISMVRGNVDGNAYYCTGSPPGAGVQGQKIQRCDLGAPPVGSFPHITFDSARWTADNFYIQTFSGSGTAPCDAARAYVEGTGSGTFQGGAGVPSDYTGVVVRIAATCTYSNSNNATIAVGKNLAIVTDGGINLTQRSNWNGSGSTNVYFMSNWPASGTPSCPTQDVYIGNNTSFNSAVRGFVYSPCTASMLNNNSAFQGQVIGNTIVIGNLFSMTYKPILVPGAQIVGFNEDIAYIREIQPPAQPAS